MEKKRIYADNAATTPVSKRAFEAAEPFLFEGFGNPSSVHAEGRRAAAAVLYARQEIAQAVGAERANEIYFTSCGSESDTWALLAGAGLGKSSGKKHIVTTAVEHHAVLGACAYLEAQGFEVSCVKPDSSGVVPAESIEKALRGDTCMVSLMAANNETGAIMPIEQVGKLCRERGLLFHVDAVQGFGHLDIDVRKLGIDMLSLSGHKIGAPKGIGALYCRSGITLPKLIFGGEQERGRRAGTENVPGIVAFGAAVKELFEDNAEKNLRLSKLRDKLTEGLLSIPKTHLNGCPGKSLPGIVNVRFDSAEGESLLLMLDMQGIAASSGSACASGAQEPSHVLRAMGLNNEQASSSVRFSLGFGNTEEDVETIIEACGEAAARLRRMRGI